MTAGLLRRTGAFLIDTLVFFVLVLLIAFLPGVFVALDTSPWLSLASFLLVINFMTYFWMGPAIFSNTYGRYVMGIRVRRASNGLKPSYGQSIIRAVLLFLGPVEALVLLFSSTKRRLGDRLTRTVEERYASRKTWRQRMVPGLVVFLLAFLVQYITIPLINSRMVISTAAISYVTNEMGTKPAAFPRMVRILNDKGLVTMRLEAEKNVVVYLSRSDGEWMATKADYIPNSMLGWGFSIKYKY